MTLSTLVFGIAVTAVLLTALTGFILHRVKNFPISFIQHFCGALFVFSGAVKAIDPLGTAYKMEQYFAEFEATFSSTSFDFLAPLFPQMSAYAASFSVGMIVFEIALGVMLLIGAAPRFTSWAFFLLVAFFTVLTGFTYLTGYVPQGVNFFDFANWADYEPTNMKVTDCGCFGDFLKLEPRVSFLKDIFLLIPAIAFLTQYKRMHQLFAARTRTGITALTVAGTLVYCLSNFVWDLPQVDFRPFAVGVNIAERLALENEAAAAVQVIGYRMTERTSGEEVELDMQEYLARYQEFPESDWELEQIKTEPTVERTKISDFEIGASNGEDMTETILSYPGYSFMIVAYKLQEAESGQWDEEYAEIWKTKIQPVVEKANEQGHRIFAVTAYTDETRLNAFRETIGADYPFYLADDILLKTIVRSNPGVVLLSNGTILEKWHYRKLPEFGRISTNYRLAGVE